MVDTVKASEQCDGKKISLPRYVIFEPDEVPEIAGEISATLTKKWTSLLLSLTTLSSQVDPFLLALMGLVEMTPRLYLRVPPIQLFWKTLPKR